MELKVKSIEIELNGFEVKYTREGGGAVHVESEEKFDKELITEISKVLNLQTLFSTSEDDLDRTVAMLRRVDNIVSEFGTANVLFAAGVLSEAKNECEDGDINDVVKKTTERLKSNPIFDREAPQKHEKEPKSRSQRGRYTKDHSKKPTEKELQGIVKDIIAIILNGD